VWVPSHLLSQYTTTKAKLANIKSKYQTAQDAELTYSSAFSKALIKIEEEEGPFFFD
jgi:hypothetical protein